MENAHQQGGVYCKPALVEMDSTMHDLSCKTAYGHPLLLLHFML